MVQKTTCRLFVEVRKEQRGYDKRGAKPGSVGVILHRCYADLDLNPDPPFYFDTDWSRSESDLKT